MNVNVNSEIGKLRAVITHTPGPEVENMSPIHTERSLYSDILNLTVATKEYNQFHSILERFTKTYEVKDLLKDILKVDEPKKKLVTDICRHGDQLHLVENLLKMPLNKLTSSLIEGVLLDKDTLTSFLSKDRYALKPLHNFFFTRDPSVSCLNRVIISKMANKVRERESIIMEAIFRHHPEFTTSICNPLEHENTKSITLEGGDVIIARDDVMMIGIGARTNTRGVDFVLEQFRKEKTRKNIIVQELPKKPESFIHLDMVFTFLDVHECMVYEPLLLKPAPLQTVNITIDNGKVSIQRVKNIPEALKSLGFDLKAVKTGGQNNVLMQEREQWHSGANFFAVAPGQVIGYSRNVYTLEALNNNGYEIIKASDIIKNKVDPSSYNKFVIAIEGSELSRGGGGARCMTMPVNREKVDWNS